MSKMFVGPAGQLKYVEKAILCGGKYISKYDALSLAAVNIDDTTEPLELPRMESLKMFTTEVSQILNEGYIEQQSILSSLKNQIEEYDRASINVISVKENNSPKSNTQAVTMVKELCSKIQCAYGELSKIIDTKLELLKSIRRMSDIYVNSIILMGESNGVLRARDKAKLVVLPHLNSLISDRFFNTSEEEALLTGVRGIWALIVLGDKDHTKMADRELLKTYYSASMPRVDWIQNARYGCIAVLLLWAISECFNNESTGREIWRDLTFSVFMCFGDLLLLLLMFGVSMRVWRTSGIDFIRLLELEHTEVNGCKKPEDMIFASASNLCMIFLCSFIFFNKMIRGKYFGSNNLAIAHAVPTCFVLFCLLRIWSPFNTRKHWLHMLWRVLAAPCYRINFRDGYIGDLLTSLVRVMIPFCFSMVYVCASVYAWFSNDLELVSTRANSWWTDSFFYRLYLVPFLTLLPLWLRLVQCLRRSVESGKRWPHIGNALKYTSAIFVIAYGTYQPSIRGNPLWVAAFVFATLYQFTWDLTQDWGMVGISFAQPGSTASGLSGSGLYDNASSGLSFVDTLVQTRLTFRQHRLIGPLWVYAAVILGNLALRFAWTLTLMPAPPNKNDATLYGLLFTHLGPVLASAEIMRRMIWGFFRLEWEQIEVSNSQELAEASLSSPSEGVLSSNSGMSDVHKFDKMEVASTIELQHYEDTYGGHDTYFGLPKAEPVPWTETDWTEILLPNWLINKFNTMSCFAEFSSYSSKVRFVEAIIFASIVMYVVVHAAIPAFADSAEVPS